VGESFRVAFEGRDAGGATIRGQASLASPTLRKGEKLPGYPQVVEAAAIGTPIKMHVYTFRYHDNRSILPIPGAPNGERMYLDPKVPRRSTTVEIAAPPKRTPR
jgi:hypothetical protein